MEQHILAWIAQYGYAGIFLLLMFGIVGLPVPDETLLAFVGYLAFKGSLSLPLAAAAALAGSTCGITLSYWLGRTFGLALIHRHGKYVHVTEEHVNRAHAWFERVGHWGLTFGYFIPGVRHLTAYAAGMSKVGPRQFALFAYSGAALWVAAFVGLGYFLGERWRKVEATFHRDAVYVTVAATVLLVGYWVLRKWRRKVNRSA